MRTELRPGFKAVWVPLTGMPLTETRWMPSILSRREESGVASIKARPGGGASWVVEAQPESPAKVHPASRESGIEDRKRAAREEN